MFNNPDLFPTSKKVIARMLDGIQIENKRAFEPSAANGNIIDYLNENGAQNVLFCEIDSDLAAISKQKAKFLKNDFLEVVASEVSHIDLIVMNPPFSKDAEHILHALDIAPPNCEIISLCNAQTVESAHNKKRKELAVNIEMYGNYENYGACFEDADRKTNIDIGYLYFKKPDDPYKTEFFDFLSDEEEEEIYGGSGLMAYDVIRDLVGRYIDSVKIYDKQKVLNTQVNNVMNGYFSTKIGFTSTDAKGNHIGREDFKKELQKSGWDFIFNKLNLKKYATSGLREDINKQIELEKEKPFTEKNIKLMLDMIVQTSGQQMEKALIEVFDKLTKHYDENRYSVEGWKTNSHYMLNQKFILPYMVEKSWDDPERIDPKIGGYFDKIEDFLKALCYLTGDNYDDFKSLYSTLNEAYFISVGEGDDKKIVHSSRHEIKYYDTEKYTSANPDKKVTIYEEKKLFGKWYDWGYFDIKCFKKGTVHFKFKDRELWGRFNQEIARIKGYPLFESNEQTRAKNEKKQAKEQFQNEPKTQAKKAKILTTIKI